MDEGCKRLCCKLMTIVEDRFACAMFGGETVICNLVAHLHFFGSFSRSMRVCITISRVGDMKCRLRLVLLCLHSTYYVLDSDGL